MRFAPKIQRYDVGTTATYTNMILGFSSSPYHFVQSIGALPGGIGRSGMVRSKELDLCYIFHFSDFDDPGDEVYMSEEHGQTVVGFRQSEVPPYSKVQSIGALPGGTGRSGMAGSKELDLCYNFHLYGFSILATR